ncbi:MAG: arginine--tRNA ligase [Candidatus Micrarchaeota archaeon]|nr:arginine--tRNA ligase [Candidatus Micrarchaeota archaeon]
MDTLEAKKGIALQISHALKQEFGLNMPEEEVALLVQDGGVEGVDIECRIAMRVAKDAKLPPQEIAKRILPHLSAISYARASVSGGYINFTLTPEFYAGFISQAEGPETCAPRKSGKVIVEYPSVNPNKPLHIGHLRNAILGDCISSLLSECGNTVVRMNYIDDLGLQVAQSLCYYIGQGGVQAGKKFDHLLGEQYVEVAAQMESDPALKAKVEGIMHGLEHGGDVCAKGREMCRRCVEAQAQTLNAYGIAQDVLVWESDIVRAGLLSKCLTLLEREGVLVLEREGKNAGCKVIRLGTHPEFKGLEDADKVIVRSNGVATYTAKDIAFQMWKLGLIDAHLKFGDSGIRTVGGRTVVTSCDDGAAGAQYNNADTAINIIGVEQEYPQKVVRVALEMAGLADARRRYVHIAYGHARLKEGRFSGRKGTWMGYSADELLQESVERARALISSRFKEYTGDEREAIARAVGVSAIRFSFIRISPEKELVFEWDKALTFEGDSGPYLQYSYARALHILDKEPIDANWRGALQYSEPEEHKLILAIARFSEVLNKAATLYEPHRIADYALALCSEFNAFYAKCRVVGAPKDVCEGRKRLVARFAATLEKCLRVLGIPVIRNM